MFVIGAGQAPRRGPVQVPGRDQAAQLGPQEAEVHPGHPQDRGVSLPGRGQERAHAGAGETEPLWRSANTSLIIL